MSKKVICDELNWFNFKNVLLQLNILVIPPVTSRPLIINSCNVSCLTRPLELFWWSKEKVHNFWVHHTTKFSSSTKMKQSVNSEFLTGAFLVMHILYFIPLFPRALTKKCLIVGCLFFTHSADMLHNWTVIKCGSNPLCLYYIWHKRNIDNSLAFLDMSF